MSKRNYFRDYFDKYKGNASKTWTAIKNMTGKSLKSKMKFEGIKIGNTLVKDEECPLSLKKQHKL